MYRIKSITLQEAGAKNALDPDKPAFVHLQIPRSVMALMSLCIATLLMWMMRQHITYAGRWCIN